MQYSKACGEEISRLAFGTMRLPLKEDGSIDQEQVEKMTDYAMEHGVNYFDTAYPLHPGLSDGLWISQRWPQYLVVCPTLSR